VNSDPAWSNPKLVVPAPKINSWAEVVEANPLLTTVLLLSVPLAPAVTSNREVARRPANSKTRISG
jgi:hypothetical protein